MVKQYNRHLEIDQHKLMYHPQRVAEWFERGDCSPIYVEVGLTDLCNHKCVFCGLDWARGKDILETKVLLKNLRDMGEFGVKAICFSGAGEPLLHKDFNLFVQKTKEFGMDVSFSTNTVLFDEKKAEETLPYTSWIRFSIDAATSETHSIIHRTSEKDFSIILNNLDKAVEIKRRNNYETTLGVQFLLLEENKKEVIKLAEILKKIGVDNLQVKPYSQNPNSFNRMSIDYHKFLELEDRLQSLSDDKFKIYFRVNRIESVSIKQDYNKCYGLPFFTIINEKGNVMPCHLYYNHPEFVYGNIYQHKFSKILNSKKRKEILEKIQQRGVHDCKKGCRLDSSNSYLYRLKNPKPHDNFI